ncbi:MAG: hypothetical protein RI957_1118 [Verrucomicrobiota bacterium]|jgi:hypothetical protein
MTRKWIGFVLAFVTGYMIWSLTDSARNGGSVASSAEQESRAKSARRLDVVAEYEALILSEEEKFQLQMDEATTFSSLIALAEKKRNNSYQWKRDALIEMLAAKYPAEALRHYAARPTDAEMNEFMFNSILSEWAKIDWGAFSMFVSRDGVVKHSEFVSVWGDLAEQRVKDHPLDCVEQFRLFSPEKQRAIMESSYATEPLGKLLAPSISDPALRSQVEERLRAAADVLARREASPSQNMDATPSEEIQERDRCERLIIEWRTGAPDPEELAEILASIKSISRQKDLLRKALEPRSDPPEEAHVWLKRISDSMAAVGEITDGAPSVTSEAKKPYTEALNDWLPKQSVRLQRAWASELAIRKDPASAFSWIDRLATESLRLDVRKDVFERWTRFSPAEATAYIAEHTNEFERSMHLPEAVRAWALRDFESAKTWLDAQPESVAKRQALEKLGGQ